MPTKRSALQSPNPLDGIAIDLLSESSSTSKKLCNDVSDCDTVAAIVGGSKGVQQRDDSSDDDVDSGCAAAPIARTPASPESNRDRFLKGFLPARSCCNLDLCRAPVGTKFNLTAICTAVFPATANPDRRYIQLADNTGSVGITVWNHNVAKFSTASVGQVVTLSKAVLGNHQGKKSLTMARDSSVAIVVDDQHAVALWWKGLLANGPLSCGAVHDIADNTIITVSGVLGLVDSEIKIVNGVEKTLVSLHLVDSCGKVDIRTWNHHVDSFLQYVERPILVRRVRVASFAGSKLCELLDGAGSIIETTFKGQNSLSQFWKA